MTTTNNAKNLANQISNLAGELRTVADDFHGDRCEAAIEFADSVEERADSISQWVADNNHVTDSQLNSLENMLFGLEKWLS